MRELLRALARKNESEKPSQPEPPAAEGETDALALLQALARTKEGRETGRQGAQAEPTGTRALHPTALAGPATLERGFEQPAARRQRARPAALVAVIGIAILAAAAAAFFWTQMPGRQGEPAVPAEQSAEIGAPAAAPPEAPAAPATEARADPQTVRTAMADCDSAAQKDPDTLYFLVTPIKRTSDAPQWSVQQWEDYGSFLLLSSNALLDGLQSGLYALNTTSFRFAIIDTATDKTQTWDAATGISTFTHKEAGAFSKFKVGFDVPGQGMKYTNEYSRRSGVCYWVNVNFRW